MLMQINMDIVVIRLDLMHVHSFPCQMVNGVRVLLFLDLMIVPPCMLIIEKNILVLGEGPKDGLDGATITAE